MPELAVGVETNFQIAKPSASLTTDDFQRLSYYLCAVGSCFPGVLDEALTSYKEFRYFSQETKEAIFRVASLLKPSLLEGKALFLTSKPMMQLIKFGYSNSYINLHETTDLTFPDDVKGLNGSTIEITRQMVYTEDWINSNYHMPLTNLQNSESDHVVLDTGDCEEENQFPDYEAFLSFILISLFSILALFIIVPVYKEKFKGKWNCFICYVFAPALLVNLFISTST